MKIKGYSKLIVHDLLKKIPKSNYLIPMHPTFTPFLASSRSEILLSNVK